MRSGIKTTPHINAKFFHFEKNLVFMFVLRCLYPLAFLVGFISCFEPILCQPILIDVYQSFGLQKTIYKIIFHLQINLDKKLNIYFLTTIRFFARLVRFVYTLYIQEKNHSRMYPLSVFFTTPRNSKTTKSRLISEILFLTICANTDSDNGIVPNLSKMSFSDSEF